jgi:hypothetical protein
MGSKECQGSRFFFLKNKIMVKNWCTDKKENKIFLIYKEIQSGAVAKSYMRKGFLIYEEMRKYSSYMRRPLVIYDFATAPFRISLYMRKI